jgi:hypothetical protein
LATYRPVNKKDEFCGAEVFGGEKMKERGRVKELGVDGGIMLNGS